MGALTRARVECHTALMAKLQTICVYCGSGPGRNPAFVAAARNFGRILAEKGIRLVYGGGSVGLMGALATAVLDHGGTVTGIIPEFLTARELALTRVQELIVTRDLHERKRLMFERADAFVALPGGIGTLEELVEQLTWTQLGRHRKPILIANIESFWDPLCTLLDHMRDLDFIRAGLNINLLTVKTVEEILPRLTEAVRALPESDREMKAAEIERL
jgi:uncharacterized protein (TIGR00730 family)